MEVDDDQTEIKDIDSPDVVDKYKAAADIANAVMAALVQELRAGQTVLALCLRGDQLIEQGCANNFKKVKDDKKGIAFPTCISVNNCAGHFSPLPEDPEVALKEGDVVKISLGVHIDGYISECAHTFVVGQSGETPLSGRVADAICAAHYAAECAVRLLRPGKKNSDITRAIGKVAAVFKASPLEGVLSHRLRQHLIDGREVIIQRAEPDQNVEEVTFEANQVYSIDIVMSTGEGKTREESARTTVFKRDQDRSYYLKLQTSRNLFSEIQKRFPSMPFTLRSLDEKARRLGIVEIRKHELLHEYPVLWEKDGEVVVQFKFTVLILPNSTMKLNNFPPPYVRSDFDANSDEEVRSILAMSTKRSKKKKKAPKKGGDAMDTS